MEPDTAAAAATAASCRTAASDEGGGVSPHVMSGNGMLVGGVTLDGVDVSAVSVTATTEEAADIPQPSPPHHTLSTISAVPSNATSDPSAQPTAASRSAAADVHILEFQNKPWLQNVLVAGSSADLASPARARVDPMDTAEAGRTSKSSWADDEPMKASGENRRNSSMAYELATLPFGLASGVVATGSSLVTTTERDKIVAEMRSNEAKALGKGAFWSFKYYRLFPRIIYLRNLDHPSRLIFPIAYVIYVITALDSIDWGRTALSEPGAMAHCS